MLLQSNVVSHWLGSNLEADRELQTDHGASSWTKHGGWDSGSWFTMTLWKLLTLNMTKNVFMYHDHLILNMIIQKNFYWSCHISYWSSYFFLSEVDQGLASFAVCLLPWFSCSHKITLLTHWGRDKMAATSQTSLSNAFSWIKMWEFCLRIHWSLFLSFELRIFQHWLR